MQINGLINAIPTETITGIAINGGLLWGTYFNFLGALLAVLAMVTGCVCVHVCLSACMHSLIALVNHSLRTEM